MGRNNVAVAKVLVAIAIVFSMASLPGPLSSLLNHLPAIPEVNAARDATLGSWYPSGPQMTTLQMVISSCGPPCEFSELVSSPPLVDLTDSPLTPAQIATICPSTNTAFSCTRPVADKSYYDVEFDLTNNFWGCSFQFGNSACGVDFRQGIAHLFDKAAFTKTESAIAGVSLPNDAPTPVCMAAACGNGGLPSANPCAWDPLFPETGSNCLVGSQGGTAYNCAFQDGSKPCPSGTVLATTNYAWQSAIGSASFCAAADHFIRGFNESSLIGVTRNSNCVLLAPGQTSPGVRWPSQVTGVTPRFDIRSTQPRLDLGTGLSQEICALFTGSLTQTCLPFFNGAPPPPATSFCEFTTSTNGTPNNCWWMYTGGFGYVFPFDSSLYFGYNSLFATKTTNAAFPNQCATQTFTSYAADYEYVCSPMYDSLTNQIESAIAITKTSPTCTAPSGTDPSFGSTIQPASMFNGSCGGKLDAVSAGYQAEDVFGRNVFAMPVWTSLEVYGRLSNWPLGGSEPGISGAIGGGYDGLPNLFNWLDAYSPNPAVPGAARQGLAYSPYSLDPFSASTVYDFYVLNNIYEGLYRLNPLCSIAAEPGVATCSAPLQVIDWMTTSHQFIPCSNASCAVGYSVAPGTNFVLRNNLRSNMHWHDGLPVTAWDVKYSYINLNATGSYQSSLLPLIKGIHVISPTQVDLELASPGPFTELLLGSVTIIPGHIWSACGANTWNSEVNTAITTKNYALVDNCIGTFSSPSVFFCPNIPPTCSLPPDAVANGLLIGSGPWVCENTGANSMVAVGRVGTGCSSNNSDTPYFRGNFTLTRNGCTLPGPICTTPAMSGDYYHGSGSLALYAWTGDTGNSASDVSNLSTILLPSCLFHTPTSGSCSRWTQGIGNPSMVGSGSGACPCQITFSQVSILNQYRGTSFIAPFTSDSAGWNPSVIPGIGTPYPPTLFEVGSTPSTLAPASVAGCAGPPYPFGNGYNC